MTGQRDVDRSGVTAGCAISFLGYVVGWGLGFAGVSWAGLMVVGAVVALVAGLVLATGGRTSFERGAGTGVLLSLGIATITSGACYAFFAIALRDI